MKRKEKKEGTWWQRNKQVISYVAALGMMAVTTGVCYIYINKYYNLKTANLIEEVKRDLENSGARVIENLPAPNIKGVEVDQLWVENGYGKAIVAVDAGVDVTKALNELGKAAGVDTSKNGFYATVEWDNQ